jgi:predicted nucleic acid-binding protein
MIVVSDTTPINHLLLAGKIFVLPELLGKVIIPSAVFQELQAKKTPEAVKEFIANLPEWLEVRQALIIFDTDLDELDTGEREAIVLAEELKADVLLIDERSGREAALKRNLPVVGTLGILERAAEKGLIDFAETLQKLKANGFFIASALEKDFLERDAIRKKLKA